jgi:hypothetical protein
MQFGRTRLNGDGDVLVKLMDDDGRRPLLLAELTDSDSEQCLDQ